MPRESLRQYQLLRRRIEGLLVRRSTLHHHIASSLELGLVYGQHARLLHNAHLLALELDLVRLMRHVLSHILNLVSIDRPRNMLISLRHHGGVNLWDLADLNSGLLCFLGFGLFANDIQHTVLQSLFVSRKEVLLPVKSRGIELEVVAFHALLEE